MQDLSLEIVNPSRVGGSIALFLLLGILLFLEIGRWMGRRRVARQGEAAQSGIGSLEGAVFALMGLLIAFTFAGALTRFDVRRGQAVDEANAIGTAYLRIELLPAAAQPRMRDRFREYVDSRIATYRALPDVAASRRELKRSEELQGEIWSQGVAATRMTESRPGADLLFLPALNQMFDIRTVRVVATQMHPPSIVYVMLMGLGLVAGLLAGYQSAGQRARDWPHHVGFAAIMALTVYVILDIEHPRLGFVRLDAIDKVLIDLRKDMQDPETPATVPPADRPVGAR